MDRGCGIYHTVGEIPTPTRTTSPVLNCYGLVAGTRRPGMSPGDYTEESVFRPGVFLTPDYDAGMPTYALTTEAPNPFGYEFMPEEASALVCYLVQLGPRRALLGAPWSDCG